MYLKQFRIRNFRTIKDISFSFDKYVNILIGENNSGKTAVIDALRICLNNARTENTINVDIVDLYVDANDHTNKTKDIFFDLIFEIENDNDRAIFIDFISQDKQDVTKQSIQIHYRYSLQGKSGKEFLKRTIYGGDNEGQPIPFEAMREIFCTYLDPLRDAVRNLRPYAYGSKIAELFNNLTSYSKQGQSYLLDEEKKEELAQQLNKLLEKKHGDFQAVLLAGMERVNQHLAGSGITRKSPSIRMSYLSKAFNEIVRGVLIEKPMYKDPKAIGHFKIHQNGLGENNLIFASVVLGDLLSRCDSPDHEVYNALLLEEPEAHLHPQYQNTFFNYINSLGDKSRKGKGLQIFITSHSPTITAKANLDNVIVMQKQNDLIYSFDFKQSDLTERNKRHLRKFLDTTKAQMLFSNGVILVEGISESILIPALAKKIMKIDLEKEGIEIVNINGVAFEHFARLYNNENIESRLANKCAVLTDKDPKKESEELSARAKKAKALSGGNLKVFVASKNTFEYDLYVDSDANAKLMRKIYSVLHPKSSVLKADTLSAENFLSKLEDFKDKGDFALDLSLAVDAEGADSLTMPRYIQKAINWIVKK